MSTHIQFLHVMRESSFLEQALTQGLMFTDHRVKFDPFGSGDSTTQAMLDYSLGKLIERATALGAKDLNLNVLAAGLGSISGSIPMICFTEVHDSRDLFPHYMNFGAYGVVVSRSWLESNGGDRVLYTGSESMITKRLHRLFVDHQIAGLQVQNGKALFTSSSVFPILDLLAYVQCRYQLAEVEWRIAGEHGFTGRRRVSGDRISLPLGEIKAVLVQKDEDVGKFEAILRSMDTSSHAAALPPVLVQPISLPNDDPIYR